MKEKTKKILKGVGLSLGAVALLCVGVGVGACSVKYGPTQPTTTTPIRKSLKQAPKKAPNFETAHNYMDDATINNHIYWESNTDGSLKVYPAEARTAMFKKGDLPNGYYYLWNGNNWNFSFLCNKASGELIEDAEELGNNVTLSNSVFTPLWNQPPYGDGYYYFEWGNYDYLFIRGYVDIYFVNALEVESEDSYFFPKDWFPSSSIYGTSAYPFVKGASGSASSHKVSTLSGAYFRANGVLYNSIEFHWQNAQGMAYGENRTTITADDLWYLDVVLFVKPDGSGNDIVYQRNWGVSSDGNTYFDGKYSWVSDVYRNIEVIDFGNTSTLDGVKKNNREWFDILANGSWTGSYDPQINGVFGLLTGALGAVFPLLAIQVLPNITLGLLLMVPLIGAIVVLIIKAVKK